MNISNDSVGLIIEYLNETDRAIISLINKRLHKIELNANCYYKKKCDEMKLKLLNNKYKNVHVNAGSLDYLNDNKNIKSIILSKKINQKIENLPNILTHLTFDLYSNFNQKIENLPNTLTHLTLGYWFNQKIEDLPKGLTHLTFGYRFNQKIDNLPNTLTYLKISQSYNQKLEVPLGCIIKKLS
jgi:hypothetical protein